MLEYYDNRIFKIGVILALVILLIQVARSLLPISIYHPDEIFQTVEIGHYLYYGYGTRSWEWLYNGGGIFDTPPFTLGPYRSLITPGVISIFFAIADNIGLNYWNQTLVLLRIGLGINFAIGLIGLGLLIRELEWNNRKIGWILFWFLIILYPDTILIGTSGLTNVIGMTPLWWSFFLYLRVRKAPSNKKRSLMSVLVGMLMVLAVLIRPDFIIFVALFSVVFFPYPINQLIDLIRSYSVRRDELNPSLTVKQSNLLSLLSDNWLTIALMIFFGGVFIFLFNGLLDQFYWNDFAVSIRNFLEFNKNAEYQTLFGTEPNGWFFQVYILERQPLLWLWNINIVILLGSLVYVVYIKLRKKIISSEHYREIITLWLVYIILVIVLIYWDGGTQPHKEIRYLYYWEFFFFAVTALILSFAIANISKFVLNYNLDRHAKSDSNSTSNIKFTTILVFLLVSSIFFIPFYSGFSQDNERISWNNFDDVTYAQSYIGQQEDLTGLIVLGGIWYDGGYTFLHRNVSMMHLDNPGVNNSLNFNLKIKNELNYLLAPHYKYFQYQFLKSNLEMYNWTLKLTILDRSDIWIR